MDQAILGSGSSSEERCKELEAEIAVLERELSAIEFKINSFEAEIRYALSAQIAQINDLTALYKQLKKAKKDKRALQKQKGKNFKGSQQVQVSRQSVKLDSDVPDDTQDLKRLYKEAIVLVHPDKFDDESEAVKERAHELTTQLIGIYKSGDIEKLMVFHDHIVSGNAMSHKSLERNTGINHQALEVYLEGQRATLLQALDSLKSSYIYEMLLTASPAQIIEELRAQFAYRISQLVKRTRKA